VWLANEAINYQSSFCAGRVMAMDAISVSSDPATLQNWDIFRLRKTQGK
jgi:hypothetical protein